MLTYCQSDPHGEASMKQNFQIKHFKMSSGKYWPFLFKAYEVISLILDVTKLKVTSNTEGNTTYEVCKVPVILDLFLET